MTDTVTLDELSKTPAARISHNYQLLQGFYGIATRAYINNWGSSFHLPPFAPSQTLDEACLAQEQRIAACFRAGQHILDVGCGIGGPARAIAATVADLHITGINIIDEQLDVAARLTRQADLIAQITYTKANFANPLPFEDENFGGAYTFDALCHSPDKRATYREVHRVLQPGATFTGTDWMHADDVTAADYARWIEPVCRYSALPDLLSPRTTAELLADAGFTVRTCYDLGDEADLSPNWDLLDNAAATIADYTDPAHQFMHHHCITTAAAGRAGAFTIGTWTATA